MAHLTPYPLAGLFARALAELDQNGSIFDLPSHRFSLGERDIDTRVTIHGRTAGAPLGPSAGPHTQLAQGIVLSWLGGGRTISAASSHWGSSPNASGCTFARGKADEHAGR